MLPETGIARSQTVPASQHTSGAPAETAGIARTQTEPASAQPEDLNALPIYQRMLQGMMRAGSPGQEASSAGETLQHMPKKARQQVSANEWQQYWL